MLTIPDIWKSEIKRGSEFGKRAAKVATTVREYNKNHSGIGSELSKIIHRETGARLCSECYAHTVELNRMSIEAVLQNKSQIIDAIIQRAKARRYKWWEVKQRTLQLATSLFEDKARQVVNDWLSESIEIVKQKNG